MHYILPSHQYMFLLVQKPYGWSSFDVVAHIKPLLRTLHPIDTKAKKRKIGHGGTLDPHATGLILIATDSDTKKLGTALQGDKIYETQILFGRYTDTRDTQPRDEDWHVPQYREENFCTAHRYEKKWNGAPSCEQIIAYCKTKIGKVSMPLPPFCAKKIAGKRMYAHARKGTQELIYSDMIFHDIKIVSYKYPLLTLRCHVGGGAYIRSLAYDLFVHTGIPATIQTLDRIALGDITRAGCESEPEQWGKVWGKRIG